MNLPKNSNSLPARRVGLVYSTGCYLTFLVTFLYLIGFVGGVLVPKDINAGPITVVCGGADHLSLRWDPL
ncbi:MULTISPECIES: hypothetical protein [Pseudomonas]|uniref:hypothetical protein n=1 Tax=Pseudomonas TaxID=286 RepID=UPI0021AD2F11|nr:MULTISPECIES: hypothetical protein [unclassified Pseudomonas]